MSRVLCVTYGAGHALIIANLVPELKKRGHEVVVFGLTTAAGLLSRKGIDSLGYVHFVDENDEQAMAIGRQMAECSPQHPDVRSGETEAYLGVGYSELVADHGKTEAARIFSEKGRQAFLPKRFLKRVIERVDPDLVITTNSPRSEQAAIEVADELGVPSVVIVDLVISTDRERIARPGFGSKLCVIGEVVKGILVSLGRRPDEVVVTGNPAFDDLGDPDIERAARQMRADKGWGDDKVVLWASQPEPADPQWGAKLAVGLAGLIGTKPGWRFVYRPHPNEGPDCTAPATGIETSGQDDYLPALLKAIDAAVVVSSTIGLQAALLGKPLVQMDIPTTGMQTDYSPVGAGVHVPDLQSCADVLSELVGQSNGSLAGFAPLGRGAANVADLADSLLPQAAR